MDLQKNNSKLFLELLWISKDFLGFQYIGRFLNLPQDFFNLKPTVEIFWACKMLCNLYPSCRKESIACTLIVHTSEPFRKGVHPAWTFCGV